MTDTSSLSQLQTISIALQGLAVGVVLVFLSNINFQIFGQSFGLTFLPIFILMYWPDKASRSWSTFFIFLLGVLQATLSFTPLGLWALCYLILFVIIGGEIKFSDRLSSAWSAYFVCILFVGIILYVVGRLLLGDWPALMPLITDAIASFIMFPVIFWARYLTSGVVSEPERREII